MSMTTLPWNNGIWLKSAHRARSYRRFAAANNAL